MRQVQKLIVCSGIAVGCGLSVGAEPLVRPAHQVNGDVRRSVQQRGPITPMPVDVFHGSGLGGAVYPDVFRSIDGTGNNPVNTDWGSAGTMLLRMMSSDYPLSDGSIPSRMSGPSSRAVSNAVCAESGDMPNAEGVSDFVWQWGQFIDHDIDETPVSNDVFDIPVPSGDAWFDPDGTGTQVIGMNRSAYLIDANGDRQHLNNITAFIDASNVYGSDSIRADEIRAHDGTGMLKVSAGDLLPFNTAALPNAPTGMDPTLFLGGDVRANEQAGLTCMHTLFMREHNYWAGQLAVQFPAADGDELYERARAIVGAELQAITFREFLPALLGDGAVGPYGGYNPSMPPMIANEFATAAYRFGHTMLSADLVRLEATDQRPIDGDLALRDAFFNPNNIIDHGIDGLLRGLASQQAQEIDPILVDDVRNFLFGEPGSGGFDLASLNIQRGRDHGIPHYNALRAMAGLAMVNSFGEISSNQGIVDGLSGVYSDVDSIDPWVGLLAEDHIPGAMVGPTLAMILGDQFGRLRDGDRFWYESYLPADLVEMVNGQTLAVIIRRNTGIGAELSDDVFTAAAPCPADITNDGIVNYFDVSAFIMGMMDADPRVDFSGSDGVFDFFDVDAFISEYNQGCP